MASIFSCRPSKYVPEGRYLLDGYKVEVSEKVLDERDIRPYIRQEPNKRILGFRFHLWLHNLSNPEKDGWLHSWLRNIGEEPVIFDPFITTRSADQIHQYVQNRGFYHSEVTDTVIMRKNRPHTKVIYRIESGDPFLINSINYRVDDLEVSKLIEKDTLRSLVRPNSILDFELLEEERARIERVMKNNGYYYFSKEQHVFFEADTTIGGMKADLTVDIRPYRRRLSDGEFSTMPHPKFKIGDVFIIPVYNPREAIDRAEGYFDDFDTTLFRGIHFLHKDNMPVKPGDIARSTHLLPGEIFSTENVDLSYRHIFGLRQYRLININFSEQPFVTPQISDTVPVNSIDTWIQLTPHIMQSYTLEMEGTNSSGNLGFGGNINYQHRNRFGGAEIFDLRLRGSIETANEPSVGSFRNTYEYGIEAGLEIPRFLLPVSSVNFVRRYNPRTKLSLAYSYQVRPDYTRTIANAGFGYTWRGSDFVTHIVNPLELNLVRLPFSTQEFDSVIFRYNLEASFKDHVVSETNYSFIFNNQDIRRQGDFTYFRFNLETAGNILTAFNKRVGEPNNNGNYKLFGTEYAQYIRSDIDFRHYRTLYDGNTLVYRFFAGAGVPYGNSAALPFEKKYFSGGANSIRAWQVRSLGPGSFDEEVDRSFPNTTADIKLEINFEYRFSMFWLLEGALFLDAGNIWAINQNDKREGALFKFNRFYNDIAIGTGVGLRFDFSFFVFRTDMGLKLRNPALDDQWIPFGRKVNYRDDMVLSIAIGYPF